MKFKDLIKTYSFWTTLAGAIVVLVQVLGRIFNFIVPNDLVHDLITAIAGVLVALGIVTMPRASKDVSSRGREEENLSSKEEREENSEEENKKEDEKTPTSDPKKEDSLADEKAQEKTNDKEEQ